MFYSYVGMLSSISLMFSALMEKIGLFILTKLADPNKAFLKLGEYIESNRTVESIISLSNKFREEDYFSKGLRPSKSLVDYDLDNQELEAEDKGIFNNTNYKYYILGAIILITAGSLIYSNWDSITSYSDTFFDKKGKGSDSAPRTNYREPGTSTQVITPINLEKAHSASSLGKWKKSLLAYTNWKTDPAEDTPLITLEDGNNDTLSPISTITPNTPKPFNATPDLSPIITLEDKTTNPLSNINSNIVDSPTLIPPYQQEDVQQVIIPHIPSLLQPEVLIDTAAYQDRISNLITRYISMCPRGPVMPLVKNVTDNLELLKKLPCPESTQLIDFFSEELDMLIQNTGKYAGKNSINFTLEISREFNDKVLKLAEAHIKPISPNKGFLMLTHPRLTSLLNKEQLLVNKVMFINLLKRISLIDPGNYRLDIILKSLEFNFKDDRYFKYLNDLYVNYNNWICKTYNSHGGHDSIPGQAQVEDYEPIIFPGEVDKTWIWNTINLEMGYELVTDGDDYYYHEAYRRWIKNYTIPTLKLNGEEKDINPLFIIRSVDVLLLDLVAQKHPIYENLNLMRLLIIIDQIDNNERIYVNSIVNKITLTPHF